MYLRLMVLGWLLILLVAQLQSSKSMILFMGCWISCFQFLFTYGVNEITFFAQVEIKAILTFVSHPDDRHHLAAVTFHKFSDLLSGLYDEFNPVGFVIMAPRLDLVKLLRSREITILAEAEMRAISAYKTCTNYRPHIASDAHVIIVCS